MEDSATPFVVRVPEQGVDLALGAEEALAWVDSELKFVTEMAGLVGDRFGWLGREYQNNAFVTNSQRELQKLRQAVAKGDSKALSDHARLARRMRVIIGSGYLGKKIKDLITEGDRDEARWVLTVFSPDWCEGNLRASIQPLRAALQAHPAFAGMADVTTAADAVRRAGAAELLSQAKADEMTAILEEKRQLFGKLEELYREKLATEEPARFWESVAKRKRVLWIFWLAVFGILVLIPFQLVAQHWESFTAGLAKVTNTSASGFSIAGLAVVTVPALLYGWLLKNVGRIFLQNLMLSDDADHRRALSLTYLGLVANPKHGIEREDRAIILNALFRPMPPHSGEDGPPAGLVELVKGK